MPISLLLGWTNCHRVMGVSGNIVHNSQIDQRRTKNFLVVFWIIGQCSLFQCTKVSTAWTNSVVEQKV
jgi:hypothetical protein